MKKIFILLIFILSLGIVNADLTQDNQAYYSFDDDLNEYNIFGATGTDGKVDSAFDFDGTNDYLNIPDSSSLQFTENDDFTISLWAKGTYDGAITEIFSKRLTNDRYNIQLDGSNRLQFQIGDGSNVQTVTDTVSFDDSNWHHIVLVYDGSLKGYKDGVSLGTDSTSLSGLNTAGADITLGKGTNGFFDGSIDEIVIFNKSLNTTEISNLYNSGTGAKADSVASDYVLYTPLDSLNDETNNSNFPTAESGVLYTNSSKVGLGAMDFDGIDDYVNLGDLNFLDGATDFSVSGWVNAPSTAGVGFVSKYRSSTNNRQFAIFSDTGGTVRVVLSHSGTLIDYDETSTGVAFNNSWNHIVVRRTSGVVSVTINGVEENLTGTYTNALHSSSEPVTIGASNSGTSSFLTGSVDEISLYNISLSPSQVLELYNGGTGFNPYSAVASTINTNLQTYYNTTDITVEVNTSTTGNLSYIVKENYLTSEPDCPLYPTVPCIPDFADKLEFTAWTNQNSSNVTLNLSDIITLIDGSYGVKWIFNDGETNLTQNFTLDTTNPSLTLNLPSEYNAYSDFNFSSYINVSDTNLDSCIVEVVGESNTTCTSTDFDFTTSGNKTINVYATDLAGNTNNSLSNVMLVNPNAYFNVIDSGNSTITNYTLGGRSDVNGTVTYSEYNDGLIIGNNTLSFEKIGYESQDINFNLSGNTPEFNQTYQVQDAEIIIEIRDKQTSQLITGTNFTAEFIATVGLTTSTTTGIIQVNNVLFLEEDYRVVISNANYQTESLFFTFTNKEILETDAYMIEKNDSNLGLVFIKAVDRFSQPLPSVKVDALQWNPVTSAYERVSSSLTGSDGVASLNVILEDKTYIFRATLGNIVVNSESEIIETFDNGKTITITLAAATSEQNYLLQNLFTDITESFNNVTNVSTITFEWEDLNGLEQTVCINAYRLLATTQTLTDENCVTGVSGTYIQGYFINSSYSVLLKAEVKIDGDLYPLKTFRYDPEDHPSFVFETSGLAKVVIPLLFLIAIALGMFMENIYIGTALLMLSSGFSLLLAPTLITSGIVTFFFFIGWVILNSGVKIR